MLKKKTISIFIFLFFSSVFYRLSAQCGDNTPRYFTMVVLINQEYINLQGGNATTARNVAIQRAQSAANALTAAFSSTAFNGLEFRVIMAPITPVPYISEDPSSSAFCGKVRNYYTQHYGCIPGSILYFAPTAIAEGNYSDPGSGVCVFSEGFNTRNIAHEIGHLLGFDHEFANDCQFECTGNVNTDNFMCSASGNQIQLNDCQLEFLSQKLYPGSSACSNWKSFIPDFISEPNFSCPAAPLLGVSATTTALIRGCNNDRDNPMYTITVKGSNTPTTNNWLHILYNPIGMQYEPQDNPEFNSEGPAMYDILPGEEETLRSLLMVDANGDRIFFDLDAYEEKTFHFKLKYNLIDTTLLGLSVFIKPVVLFHYTSNVGSPGTVKKGFQHKIYSPVSGVNPFFYAGQPLIFTENTIFPTDTWLPSSDMMVKKGVEIRFDGGTGTFISDKVTTIEGCGFMWKGIKVTNAKIDIKNKIIKDAQVAIQLNQGATGEIINSQFVNNTIGVSVPGVSLPHSNVVISGNTFRFEGENFKPPYSVSQFPSPTGKSYAGIVINNHPAFSIGSNNFSNQKNGILSTNSTTTVSGCTFTDILAPGESLSGKCISSEHGTLSAHGNIFTTARVGVYSLDSKLAVTTSMMDKIESGIVSVLDNDVEIRDNKIVASGFGIKSSLTSPLYGGARIYRNTVSVKGNDDGIGIYVGGTALFAGSDYQLEGNTINVLQGRSGLHLNEMEDTKANLNTITLAGGTKGQYGIRIENGDRLDISENIVSGSGTSLDIAQRAVYGVHPTRSAFRCNNVNKTTYGLNFAGTCLGKNALDVNTNTFLDHYNGLLLGLPGNGNAAIGEQIHKGNRWAGDYDDAGARFIGDPFIALLSIFKVDNMADPEYLPNTVSPQAWFTNENAGGNTLECLHEGFLFQDPFIGHDKKIILGQITGQNDGGLMEWMAKRRLYERIFEEGNTYSDNSLITNFMSTSAANAVGAFGSKASMFRNAFNVSTQTQADTKILDEDISDYMSKIAWIDSLLMTTSDSLFILNLLAQRNALIEFAAQSSVQKHNLLTGVINTRQSQLVNAYEQVNQLTTSSVFQSNEKTVGGIDVLSATMGQVPLSSEQTEALWKIAEQCPLTGGDAVLRARMILQVLSDSPLHFSDDRSCGISERSNLAYVTQVSQYRIQPNPVNDVLTVYCPTFSGEIKIYNSIGQLMASKYLKDGNTQIQFQTSNWSEGAYFCKIGNNKPQLVTVQH